MGSERNILKLQAAPLARLAPWLASLALLASPLLLGAPLVGCKRIRERQAIRRYARGAAQAEQKLLSLRAAEAGAGPEVARGEPARVRRYFREKLLPAFKAYRDALARVVPGTARLRRIHARYLRAINRAYEAHASFADQVTSVRLGPAWEQLRSERRRMAEARSRYQADLAAYYRENDVKLANQP